LQYSSNISTSIAVIRGTPNGHQIFIGEPELISLLNKLMGSANEVNTIKSSEFLSNLRSKQPAGASGVESPSINILGVRPHQITERTFMGNFDFSLNGSNLIKGLDIG